MYASACACEGVTYEERSVYFERLVWFTSDSLKQGNPILLKIWTPLL